MENKMTLMQIVDQRINDLQKFEPFVIRKYYLDESKVSVIQNEKVRGVVRISTSNLILARMIKAKLQGTLKFENLTSLH